MEEITSDNGGGSIEQDPIEHDLEWYKFDRMENEVGKDAYIHRVPIKLRFGHADKYEPSVLSIGPYHHIKATWALTGDHKERAEWQVTEMEMDRKREGASKMGTESDKRKEQVSDIASGSKRQEQKLWRATEIQGRAKWQVSENRKKEYMNSLLARETKSEKLTEGETDEKTQSEKGKASMEAKPDILEFMEKDIGEDIVNARKCYSEKIDLNNAKFVQMLILDGCFILELFYKCQSKADSEKDKQGRSVWIPDAIFNNNWILPCIVQDLVLLENQIPFNVLEKLFARAPKLKRPPAIAESAANSSNHTNDTCIEMETVTEEYALNELITNFFAPILPPATQPILPPATQATETSTAESQHLLDFLRLHLLKHSKPVEMGTSPNWEHTTCATDLKNSGVSFKRKDKHTGLLDVTFKNGIFEMTPFNFTKSWTILIPNIVALEQCRKDIPDKVTSYAILLDNLINSHNDVKLLREKRIIEVSREEDEMIAHDLNSLFKQVIYDQFYYDQVCNKVNEYRRGGWHNWKADFTQNYIQTPWAGLSLIAAILLLLLAATQTGLSITEAIKGK